MEASETTQPAPAPEQTPAAPAPQAAPDQQPQYADQRPAQPEPQKAPDVGEQIAALTQRLDKVLPQEPGENDGRQPASLYEGLQNPVEYGEDPNAEQDPNFGYEQPAQQQAAQPGEEDPLDTYLRERVAEYAQAELGPLAQQLEAERQRIGVSSLEQRYEDIGDYADAIANRLAPIAQQTGYEAAITDPQLVEMAYLAERALKNASSEVPAEQAASGAPLETGAGAPAPGGELSEEDNIRRGIMSAVEGAGAFG